MSNSNNVRIPRLVVFDLDNCCWDPEMYQMRDGAPFTYDASTNSCTSGRSRERVELMGDVPEIWGALRNSAGLTLGETIGRSGGGNKALAAQLPPELASVVFDAKSTKILKK